MRVRAALPFLLACLLVAGLVAGVIVERQGRSDPAGHTPYHRLPTLIAYSGGPGEIVLEWSSDAVGIARWQYRVRDPHSRPWGAWTDVPDSDADTAHVRLGGLAEDTSYHFEVRPLIAGGSEVTPGDPFEWTRAQTLFVGDDGIPWLRAHLPVEGGRTYRIGRSEYVIDAPGGMVLSLGEISLHADGSFSGALEHRWSGSVLSVRVGEYVGRRVAWTPEGSAWAAGGPDPLVVNEWFDEIVASTRRVPYSGPGPEVRDGSCASGAAAVNPATAPSLSVDCAALLIVARQWRDGALNWDASAPIGQWDGVIVGGTPPRVQRVELPDRDLEGIIDAMFARLSALTHLDLRGNQLTGEIPPDLGALKSLELLHLAGNEGLYGCVPRPLRQVPRNDLDYTLLPDCAGTTAGLKLEGRATYQRTFPSEVTVRAPGTLRTAMVVGENQWLTVSAPRAPGAPVTVEFLTGANRQVEVEPGLVRFEEGVPGQSGTVQLTALKPGENIAIRVRTRSTGDSEYHDLAEIIVLITVASTHLRTLIGGDVGEVVLEWSTFEENVERWQYRQKELHGRWGEWTDIPGSSGDSARYRVTGLEEWGVYEFVVRPWSMVGPGEPSNRSGVVTARGGQAGVPVPYPRSEVEAGRRYFSLGYTVDVPHDMRLGFGLTIGGYHSDGAGKELVDFATGSSIVLWSDGTVRGRVIESLEVAGKPGSIASMRNAREANRRFDELLDSLRNVPVAASDDGGD